MARLVAAQPQADFFARLPATNQRARKQVELLQMCVSKGLNLSDELRRRGMTYDDLVYAQNEPVLLKKSRYFKLEDFARKGSGIPVASFFSGAGGADLGFEAAGFEHTALVEHNEIFCKTLKFNRPHWDVIGPPDQQGDVSDTDGMVKELRIRLGKSKKGFDGVFVGGPPCQPFSIAANQRFSKRGENFKRVGFAHQTNGNLLFDFIALIEIFRPRAFLIENVLGLFDVDSGSQLRKALQRLSTAGYLVESPFALNAAQFLVPQQRNRLFIVGSREGKAFRKPEPRSLFVPCIRALERIKENIPNHETRAHEAESVLRYMNLGYGERDQLGRVDRLHPGLPSKTVIAGGTSGGGRSHLHPYMPRTLSVRESARLQTFPDGYEFTGAPARQFTQVGNAVPPILAAQLAIAIATSYF